jgi:CBS domain-containing protein
VEETVVDNRILEFLSTAEPFAGLPEADRRWAASRMALEDHPPDRILFRQGQTSVDRLLIIRHGGLVLYYDRDGDITLREYLQTGDIFGGISILMNAGLALRTVQTETDGLFYSLSKSDFRDLCARHPDFRQFFVEAFGHRINSESYAALITAGQTLKFLADVQPFNFLPFDDLELAAQKMTVSYYPAGTVVLVQGQSRVEHLYILQRGAAEQFVEEESRRSLHEFLDEGDVYGGISMLVNHGVSLRTLRVTEDSYFYLLEKPHFLNLCEKSESFSDYFTDIFGKRMMDRTYAALVAQTHQGRDQSLQIFSLPVESVFVRDPLSCPHGTSIRQAARIMSDRGCSSILVAGDDGDMIGLVTDTDLRKKVIAEGIDTGRPVKEVMNAPLITVPAQSLVFEALLEMNQSGVKHLAVTDVRRRVIGMLTGRDLTRMQGQTPFLLIPDVKKAATVDEIAGLQKQLPHAIQTLMSNGAKPENVTRLITALSDAVLDRLIDLAIDQLGPPPCRFAFMVLGSDGRREQTLKTDQDNAIVYEDLDEAGREEAEAYFKPFAETVCGWLDQVGYTYCPGDVMAQNPKLRQPLSVWRQYFADWINHASPADLLQASIFFDFRLGWGDRDLVDALKSQLMGSLGDWAGFFRRLTENALHYKPPLGFFRNFLVESKGEHRNMFDIKSAMLPLVDMARIYALKHGIPETNTLQRFQEIQIKKGLPATDCQELIKAYAFLMQIRLTRQVSAVLDENAAPENYVNPKKLSRLEQTMLKEIFQRISKFQSGLGLEFTGVA